MKSIKNISEIEELSLTELQLVNGGKYDILDSLVEGVSFAVGYVGRTVEHGVDSFLKHAPRGSYTYIN